jgi:hypothetical protein
MTGKERLIELLKLQYAKTDEDHPLSTAQIVTYFENQGVTTSRLTVKADIETLNNFIPRCMGMAQSAPVARLNFHR